GATSATGETAEGANSAGKDSGMARELRAHPDKQRCESRANLSCWLWRCNVAFPRNRFAYQIISDRDHERAIEAVNRHTSQGWRARQMCVDPRDGSLVVLLEL